MELRQMYCGERIGDGGNTVVQGRSAVWVRGGG